MRTNEKMLNAQASKKDEFYTMYDTVSNELVYYWPFLHGKRVYCNCDRPDASNIWKYLKDNFIKIGLKSLVSTFYGKGSYGTEITMRNGILKEKVFPLKGDGDYRSEECMEILKNSDVAVTNPPFSLAGEYVSIMYKCGRDFIVLGNQNIMTFRDVYPHVLDHTLHLGISIRKGDVEFEIPLSYKTTGKTRTRDGRKFVRVTGIRWFTSFDHGYYPKEIPLHTKKWNIENNTTLTKMLVKKYGSASYPEYDNYPAIEVPYTKAIPSDYEGIAGVPISFFDKYNPSQFEIVGFRKGLDGKDLSIKGKNTYFRFLIKKKRKEEAVL